MPLCIICRINDKNVTVDFNQIRCQTCITNNLYLNCRSYFALALAKDEISIHRRVLPDYPIIPVIMHIKDDLRTIKGAWSKITQPHKFHNHIHSFNGIGFIELINPIPLDEWHSYVGGLIIVDF